MNRLILGMAFGTVLLIGTSVRPAMAQHDNKDHSDHADKTALPNCPIVDEPVNLALSIPTDDGPVYFCCKGCIPKFQKSPGLYAAQVAMQRKMLAHRTKIQVTCPVSGEPVDHKIFVEENGKKVYMCCKGCARKYKSDPAKFSTGLANSYSFQATCPVTGGDIDPSVSTKLSTGETIYFCCAGCSKKLRENPAKYNDKLVSQGIVVNWKKVK